MKKNLNFSKFFDNKQTNVIISVIIAVVSWLMVSLYINTEDSRVIQNVPVKLDYSATAYQSIGLSIVDETDYKVSVEVTGPRSVIGGLTGEDITVYPQLSGVTEAGRYDLVLVATKSDALLDYQILNGGISPKTLSVRFDMVKSKKFVVEVDTTGVKPAEGYLMDKAFANPGEITLSGPESEISKISRVVAQVDLTDDELSESKLTTGKLSLFDRDDNPIGSSLIKYDNENIEVTIPILKKATLPIKLDFSGVPEGLDTSIFKYTLSVDEINIAGPGSKIDEMKELQVGYINIAKDFKLGGEHTYDITLEKGFLNLDNITKVTVSFDTSELISKTISVEDIRAINEPQNYKVNVQTTKLHDVTIIGKKSEIDALNPNEVVAQINAAQVSAEQGEQTLPVTIKIPGTTTCFAVGSYTALVDVVAAE